jgi:hypothetical protein
LPADSITRRWGATRLPGRHAPATQPAPAKPAGNPQSTPETTTPAAAAQPPGPRPSASQLVATPSPATNPVATNPVATEPVATQSLSARPALPSPGNRTRRLYQRQAPETQSLRADTNRAARPVTPADPPLAPTPSHPPLGLARGPIAPATGSPPVVAGDAGLESRSARVALPPPRPAESPRQRSVTGPHAGTPPPIPHVLSPPPVQKRPPVGGTAAAAGGGTASVAPSVVAEFEALALALAMILLARSSLDLAIWRSTLFASRLEHPG